MFFHEINLHKTPQHLLRNYVDKTDICFVSLTRTVGWDNFVAIYLIFVPKDDFTVIFLWLFNHIAPQKFAGSWKKAQYLKFMQAMAE